MTDSYIFKYILPLSQQVPDLILPSRTPAFNPPPPPAIRPVPESGQALYNSLHLNLLAYRNMLVSEPPIGIPHNFAKSRRLNLTSHRDWMRHVIELYPIPDLARALSRKEEKPENLLDIQPRARAKSQRPLSTRVDRTSELGPLFTSSNTTRRSLRLSKGASVREKLDPEEVLRPFLLEGAIKKISKKLEKENLSVKEVFCYSKKQLAVLNLSKKCKKAAQEITKHILNFVGEKTNLKLSSRDSLKELITFGLDFPENEIRNEIYLQTIRYTIDNPERAKAQTGLDLLFRFASLFVPASPVLSRLLTKYLSLRVNKSSSFSLDGSAVMTVLRMFQIIRDFPEPGLLRHSNIMDKMEIFRTTHANFYTLLDDILEYEGFVPKDGGMPKVLVRLLNGIKENGGNRVFGIFSAASDPESCVRLQVNLEFDQPTEEKDPSVYATVLKHWMTSLEDPIWPAKMYIRALKAKSDGDEIMRIANDLPLMNKVIIREVGRVLMWISESESMTKMTITSLAQSMIPCVMRLIDDAEELDALERDKEARTEILKTLFTRIR